MKRDFQRGTISVFLTIILVPCIVVSSLFVDLSRVKLSQSVATSASDLALNSLMSYYDKDLSKLYGLMASCQNIEEFYDETAQFFLDALHSQGLEDDDIDSMVALYSSIVGDNSVYDLLQMELQTEESGNIISAVEGASLGESSLLIKDQIVDFMKYRGPIEITKGIVDQLKNNNVAEQLTEASKNEPLVEDKQDYAEATGDLLDACYKSYYYIKQYVDMKPSLTELRSIANNLKAYRELYREINSAIVINFSNTSGLAQFTRPLYSINTYTGNYSKTSSEIYSRTETVNGVTHYYIDGSDIQSSINEMQEKINEFNTSKANLINAASSWINMSTGSGGGQVNEIQWWVKVHNAINKGSNSQIYKYQKAAESMLKMYAQICAMLECEDGNEVPSDWRNICASLQSQVQSLQSKYLSAGVTNSSDQYLKLVSRLETISANNIRKINSSTFTLSNGKTIGSTVSEIKSKLDENKTKLNQCIKYLDAVIDGKFFEGVKSLDAIKKLVKEYKEAFDAWEGTANRTGTQMAEDDKTEIADERDKYGEVNAESVTELKTRLVNIRAQMQSVVDGIDSVIYGSKKICEISNYNGAYNAIKSKIDTGRLGMTNNELTSYANEVFSTAFKPSANESDTILELPHAEDPNYNPDLTVSKPSLYVYWEKQYENVENAKLEDSKSQVNGGKDKTDAEEKNIKDKDRVQGVSETNIYGNYSGEDFPSGLDAASSYKLGNSILEGIAGLATSVSNGSFTNIRDSLYSTEYVMDMFSYATYANEGKYNLYKENHEDEKIPDTAAPFSDYDEQWENKELTFTDNKSLTNQMINMGNNVAYGAEAEYVLYGKTNKDNIKAAYADIFSIRYPLNLVSGFQNFWPLTAKNSTARTIRELANEIAALTQGVIPAVVTKSVLIALITVFETGKDLDRLQNGFPVEIYKNEEDWRFALDGWNPVNNADEKNNTSGLFYSDYIYMFLYLGFESSSASEMYLRIGDVIQANMRKEIGSSSYTLKKSKTYFKLDATIRVNPLMLSLPYATQYSNNPKDETDWCTFKISEIRGYS